MQDLAAKKETAAACACGHPEREHSACTGECYLCACKHYTPAPAARAAPPLLARAYRYILTRMRPTGPKGTGKP